MAIQKKVVRRTAIVPLASNMLLRFGSILVVWFLAGESSVLAEEAFAPNLCMLPVGNSTVEAARALAKPADKFIEAYPASLTLARTVRILPGVPKPILYPWFEGLHAWTVSQDNSFEALEGPFPSSTLWDKFAVETETGRVVGAREDGVYAFDGSMGQFKLIVRAYIRKRGDEVVDPTAFYRIHTIAHIARLGLTLIGTDNGVFQLVGETIRPLAGAGRREVGPVTNIVDLPVHRGIALAGDNFDMAGGGPGAMLRHDDGSVERLASIRKGSPGSGDYVITASESQLPGRIILRTAKTLLEVEMQPSPAGFSPSNSSTLMSSSGNLYVTELKARSGEYLILGRKVGWFSQQGLERLEPDGLHTVPGEPVNASGDETYRISELKTFGQILIEGQGHRYIYDGNRVVPLQVADPDRIGRHLIAADLSSVGKVVFRTERDLFELTEAGQLKRLRLPFEYGSDGFVNTTVSDFPAAHVGLIATKGNLYALNPSGVVQPIRGANYDGYSSPFAGEIPGRHVMLILGRNSLHLIVTGAHCNEAPVQ